MDAIVGGITCSNLAVNYTPVNNEREELYLQHLLKSLYEHTVILRFLSSWIWFLIATAVDPDHNFQGKVVPISLPRVIYIYSIPFHALCRSSMVLRSGIGHNLVGPLSIYGSRTAVKYWQVLAPIKVSNIESWNDSSKIRSVSLRNTELFTSSRGFLCI